MSEITIAARLIALRDEMLRLEDDVCWCTDVPEYLAVRLSSWSHRFEAEVGGLITALRQDPPVIASQIYDKEKQVVSCSNCHATLYQVRTAQPRPFHFEDDEPEQSAAALRHNANKLA